MNKSPVERMFGLGAVINSDKDIAASPPLTRLLLELWFGDDWYNDGRITSLHLCSSSSSSSLRVSVAEVCSEFIVL
ncbi:hypothetical protein HanRHA438_Chr09g0386261 [Helianthus annuus]|nr:hypothetical protein HanRHA438_Chr09g0386261 [Helianthus annuus]